MADLGWPLPQDAAFPPIPKDDGGPVFREPWEAQAFALVVALHRAGHIAWPEWVATIAEEIRHAADDFGRSQDYYRHWLAALETIAEAKQFTGAGELDRRLHEIEATIEALHDHPAQRAPIRID